MKQRVSAEPAIVLHVRPYRETSVLVDLMTHHHGRVGGVARGARQSRRAQTLQPFYAMTVAWTGRDGLVTLTQWDARRSAWFTGNALASAYYAAELVMRLTREHEPHTRLFETLDWLMGYLGDGHEIDIGLRQFESVLLAELGYGVDFLTDASGEAITPEGGYRFEPGVGFVSVDAGSESRAVNRGGSLLDIGRGEWRSPDARRVAKQVFRTSLDTLLGPKPLQSRRLLRREASDGT